jgi:hypothetical protein
MSVRQQRLLVQLQTDLPQIDYFLKRDVRVIVAAPFAAIFGTVTAVADEERVGIRVAISVQELFDAPEDVARL